MHPTDGARRIPEMVAAGAAGFKFSTFGTHPDRFPRIPPQVLYECFEAIAPTGLIAGAHNENDEFVRAATAAVEASESGTGGRTASPSPDRRGAGDRGSLRDRRRDGLRGAHRPLLDRTRLRNVRGYGRQGYETTVEACIHYLVLDEENDVRRLGGRAKINPPVRPRREVEALWSHLAAGNVTVVSTDHVSWTLDRKSDPDMLKNASGAPSLEVLVLILLKGLSERNLSPTWAARLLAANPARLFRIGHMKGAGTRSAMRTSRSRLALAGTATIRRPAAIPWPAGAPTRDSNCIIASRPRSCAGELAFDGKAVVAGPGTGRCVTPRAAERAET